MNTTQTNNILNRIADGVAARLELNVLCKEIYDEYLSEIHEHQEKLEADFAGHAWYDNKLSELESCNQGYHSFRPKGEQLELTGWDHFRCEESRETDLLPMAVLRLPTKEERTAFIKDLVAKKAAAVRQELQEEVDKIQRRAREANEARYDGFDPTI